MRESNYNILVDHPATGQVVFYNSLYGSIAVLDQAEAQLARDILEHPEHPADSSELWNALVSQKYLIEDGADELAIIKNRRSAGVRDENRLDVIVMPTIDCNFACKYCYEPHYASLMDDETEAAIKSWLAKEIPKHKILFLSWFGGEPLMGYNRVISLSKHAAGIATNAGVPCIMHMTTNAFLLDRRRTKELIETGITNYQITLDGTPEFHNALRCLKSGGPTFDQVFRNIVALASEDPKVQIALRVNFNHTNHPSIPSLLEMFPEKIRGQLRVLFEPIFGESAVRACGNISPEEMSQAVTHYLKIAQDLGYQVVLGLSAIQNGKLVYCYAERANQVAINYNGEVHKCTVSDFCSSKRVGHINSEGILVKEGQWEQWVREEEILPAVCQACVYLPLCMGGCRNKRLKDEPDTKNCAFVRENTLRLLQEFFPGNFLDSAGNGQELSTLKPSPDLKNPN